MIRNSDIDLINKKYNGNIRMLPLLKADDGAGNPFYLEDGKVYEFDPIDGESTLKADSFETFFA